MNAVFIYSICHFRFCLFIICCMIRSIFIGSIEFISWIIKKCSSNKYMRRVRTISFFVYFELICYTYITNKRNNVRMRTARKNKFDIERDRIEKWEKNIKHIYIHITWMWQHFKRKNTHLFIFTREHTKNTGLPTKMISIELEKWMMVIYVLIRHNKNNKFRKNELTACSMNWTFV